MKSIQRTLCPKDGVYHLFLLGQETVPKNQTRSQGEVENRIIPMGIYFKRHCKIDELQNQTVKNHSSRRCCSKHGPSCPRSAEKKLSHCSRSSKKKTENFQRDSPTFFGRKTKFEVKIKKTQYIIVYSRIQFLV